MEVPEPPAGPLTQSLPGRVADQRAGQRSEPAEPAEPSEEPDGQPDGQVSGRTILVTGGSGFVGTSVVRALRRRGARVTVADRVPFPDGDVTSVVGDLDDPAVRDAAVTEGLDGVVHLAAVTSVLRSVDDPGGVYRTNVDVTQGLLELARARGVERFLLSSTNAVVGDVGDATIREDEPLRPLTPYGASKAAAEMLLWGYSGAYGMTTCALRLTNVYGPGMSGKDSFVPRLMRAACSDQPVRVFGDGSQCRDFVHVDDVVRGLLVAWQRRYTGPLIIGSGRSVRVLEILDAARRVTGRRIPAEHVPPKPGEMPAVIVDVARAAALGYRPTVTLDAGLATVWQEFSRMLPGVPTSLSAGDTSPASGQRSTSCHQ